MSTLGQAIARHRVRKGLKQEELAELVGLSRGGIAQIETNRIAWPRPETLRKLAEVLDVPMVELLREADILPPASGESDPEIRKLIEEQPEVGELLDLVRKYPEYLPVIVRMVKWLVAEKPLEELHKDA